ncbi:methyltransferase domain-containing protein [Paenibacillus sp. 1P07SE]|uniref:methyltransferase domain-containing protein n=1 Tax=Paenibacillus sp. 1P07SE TaxID=3132209 RepID=UPI0039A61083
MLRALGERAVKPELMDDAEASGPELSAALRQLRLLNRLFHAAGPTLYGVERLWQAAGRPKRLRVTDIGSGSGDVNLALLRWADRQRIAISIQLVDMTAEACAAARLVHRMEPRITVVQDELFRLSRQGESADIVTATQFLHHFTGPSLIAAAEALSSMARLGVVVSDIHRHWLAWLAVWGASRLLPGNRYIRHDGPLSVAKGFRGADWTRLAAALPGLRLEYSWRPLFRYAVWIRPDGRGGLVDG